jgi:hypothetical protein
MNCAAIPTGLLEANYSGTKREQVNEINIFRNPYLKEEIPTVQIKIVKRNDPKPYWFVQLTDVRIFEDDFQNEPGFVTYNLRFSGACTIVDNRPADAA